MISLSIYLLTSDEPRKLSMRIPCKLGAYKSSRGIFGIYSRPVSLVLYDREAAEAVEDAEKNSAKPAAGSDDSLNQYGIYIYFPRSAHRTESVYSRKPPRFRGKGRHEHLQSCV